MTLKLEDKISKLEFELSQLRAKHSTLGKKISKSCDVLRELYNERDTKILAEKIDKNEIDFELILTGDAPSKVMWEEKRRQLNMLGLSGDGYWSGSGQTAIKITLNKGDKKHTEQVYTSLCLIIPHLIPYEPGACKRISIFEHTLSEHAIYYLDILECSEPYQVVTHRKCVKGKFEDLRSALDFIEQNYWYENKTGDSESFTEDDFDDWS